MVWAPPEQRQFHSASNQSMEKSILVAARQSCFLGKNERLLDVMIRVIGISLDSRVKLFIGSVEQLRFVLILSPRAGMHDDAAVFVSRRRLET